MELFNRLHCKLLRFETTGFCVVADGTSQPPQYVLSPCESMEQRFYAESC